MPSAGCRAWTLKLEARYALPVSATIFKARPDEPRACEQVVPFVEFLPPYGSAPPQKMRCSPAILSGVFKQHHGLGLLDPRRAEQQHPHHVPCSAYSRQICLQVSTHLCGSPRHQACPSGGLNGPCRLRLCG